MSSRNFKIDGKPQWDYRLENGDIIRLDDDRYSVSTYYCEIINEKRSKKVVKGTPIICNKLTAEMIKERDCRIFRDNEKNFHAVIRQKGFNCPLYYFSAMRNGLIPDNRGPYFNDYFCLFKDGNINNILPDNLILVKITKDIRKKKKVITDKYINNAMKGSNVEVQQMFFEEARKIYNFPNAALDSNLNDAWRQLPRKDKDRILNEL